MSRPGRLLQELMRPDTAEAIAERRRYAAIRAQVDRERDERYPCITTENAREMIAWQELRIKELCAAAVQGRS